MQHRTKSNAASVSPREGRGLPWQHLAAVLAPLLLYAAVVVWLTWPLARQAGTDLPDTALACRFDSLLLGWALAHESRALTTDPAALPHGNIYHPARHALFYGEAGFGALPFFLPVFELTANPTLALNAVFLLPVILTAWALHLTIWWWTGNLAASWIAAWTFLTTRWVLWTWIPCAPNYAVLCYLPLILFLAAAPAWRAADAIRLVPLLALQALTSVYVATAMLAPLVTLAAGRLARGRTRRAGVRLLAALAAGLCIVLPIYAGYLLVRANNPLLVEQSVWHGVPQLATNLPWDLLSRSRPTGVPVAALLVVMLGTTSLVLGGWRRLRGPERHAWTNGALWVAVGVVMSLGAFVIWRDRWIALPHYMLGRLTSVYDVIRVPNRLGIPALIGACVLTGLALAELSRRAGGSAPSRAGAALALAALASGAMYGEYAHGVLAPPVKRSGALPGSYPLRTPLDGPTSEILGILARSRGPLLELPVPNGRGGGPSPEPQAEAMYRSIFHRRPILNGYSGYWPRRFMGRMDLARRLPDPDALQALRRETDLQTILVRTDKMRRRERERWLATAAEASGTSPLRLIARSDRGELVFEVHDHAAMP